MFKAVFMSVLTLTVLCLVAVGLGTVGGAIALATGHVTPFQAVEAIQLGVDNVHIWGGSLGVAGAVATLKAVRPFAVGYARTWISELIRSEVYEAMK